MIYNYTIIIPHKNTTDLLRKCIDSIPKRDDVQIIVVDDNSDEDKVDFEQFPGLNEERTEVYLTKEGKGAGYARNIGLQHALGKWIIFADADDYFHPCINDIMDKCLEIQVATDLIFFKGDSINLLDGTNGHRADSINQRIDVAIRTNNYQPALFYSSPWCKVYNRNFLLNNNISFNEVPCGNDVVFMAKVARYVGHICAVDDVAYCISCSQNSITSVKNGITSEIRLQQDIIGLNLYKERYQLTSADKYWYFETWHDLYKTDPNRSFKYIKGMWCLLGCSFVINVLKSIKKRICQ